MSLYTISRNFVFLCLFFLCQVVFAQYKQTLVNTTVLLENKQQRIPLVGLDELEIAVLSSDLIKYESFVQTAKLYTMVDGYSFSEYFKSGKQYNLLIVVGTMLELRDASSRLLREGTYGDKDVIFVVFDKEARVVQGKTDLSSSFALFAQVDISEKGQRHAAMSVFGGVAITQGHNKTEQTRIQYSSLSYDNAKAKQMLSKIDAIAEEAIKAQAAPGMVVLAVKDGQVIFSKAYGTHTYSSIEPTKVTDIFDLASISKIVATTPVIMHLYDEKVIELDSAVSYYLPVLKNTDKASISVRSVLLHEAGFTPFIPFYRGLGAGDLQRKADEHHLVKVADSAYLLNNYYEDVMWPAMLRSELGKQGSYLYSDISMYMMKELAENLTNTTMDSYVDKLLYKPLGMQTAGFNPRKRFVKQRIVPTQHDTSFRKVLLQGHVHDEGAAMAGGVAGHAGLFATANDLAIYAQMLLNRGTYGGVRYFQPETVDLFTSKQSHTSRRGLGFDRAEPTSVSGYPSKRAGAAVFGHTGYTGTALWIDPESQLIYIFLSNRVHPQVTNKLFDLNIRSRIQDVIYEFVTDF